MRELRTCPVTGRVVLLNDTWVDRPAPPVPVPAEPCWFCRYNGPTITRDGSVRAVAHPVPVLGVEGDARAHAFAGAAVRREGVGAHELVYGLHVQAEAPLLRMVVSRMADLRGDARLRGFGATRRHMPGRHAVWQVFALPYDLAPSSPAAWRDKELEAQDRVIERGAQAASMLAWAPRVPFETWVMPATGTPSFGSVDPGPVAEATARAMLRLSRALRDPPMDLVLVDGWPWRIEILPRLAEATAIEAAMGIPVHGTLPEAAAEHLRGMREAR